MPGTTATQGLIYPTSGDRACDGALQLEVLAQGIDARLTVLDGIVDNGAEPPCVLVEYVGEALNGGGTINWNTVQVDTAGAFDASISPAVLTLPYTAPGQLWEIGCYVKMDWDNSTIPPATEVKWSIELELYTQAGVEVYDFGLGDTGAPTNNARLTGGGQSHVVFHETTGNDTIQLRFLTPSFSSETELVFAQLWAIQVSEA